MRDPLRSQLIRLAASLPKGSEERRELLAVLDDPEFAEQNLSMRDEYLYAVKLIERTTARIKALSQQNFADPRVANRVRLSLSFMVLNVGKILRLVQDDTNAEKAEILGTKLHLPL